MQATVAGLALWIFNFYVVLIWLQPLLLGGRWIVDGIPPWVAALTHLAFTWTMAALEAWTEFEPYRGADVASPDPTAGRDET